MNQPLAEAIFWVAALACIVAELMILRSSFNTTRGKQATALPASRRASETAWAIIPGIGLAILLAFTWRDLNRAAQHRAMDHSQMSPGMAMPSMQH